LDSYSSTTRGADGLLSHLGLALSPALSPTWLAICLASLIPTSIAPQELLETEEKAANQLDLEREKDSVTYLSQARDDIEGTIPSQTLLASELRNLIVIRRAASDPSDARLDQAGRQSHGLAYRPSSLSASYSEILIKFKTLSHFFSVAPFPTDALLHPCDLANSMRRLS
jgi:hypothetical protein